MVFVVEQFSFTKCLIAYSTVLVTGSKVARDSKRDFCLPLSFNFTFFICDCTSPNVSEVSRTSSYLTQFSRIFFVKKMFDPE